jgi:hypothetical protein
MIYGTALVLKCVGTLMDAPAMALVKKNYGMNLKQLICQAVSRTSLAGLV